MTIVAPKDNRPSFGRTAEHQAIYQSAVDKFTADLTALLDSACPNWKEWVKIAQKGRRYHRTWNLCDIVSHGGRGSFRRVEEGKEFTLSAKHIATINAFIAERASRQKHRNEQQDAFAKLSQVVKPTIERFRDRFDVEHSEIRLSGILLQTDHYGKCVEITINRQGAISEPRSYYHNDIQTMAQADAFISTFTPLFETITKLAEDIKADLPSEYFSS